MQDCSATSCWNSQIATVAQQVLVVMTEFGYENSDPSYFENAMTWADSARLGYLPWAWWDQSGSGNTSYALYTGSSYALAAEGAAYQAHMAKLPQ